MNELTEFKLAGYNTLRKKYERVSKIALKLLDDTLRKNHTHPMQVTHRIKATESIAGKLERRPDKYTSADQLMDILGIRIICYFTDHVDQVAFMLESILDIDWKNSSDKREIIDPTAFGYLSLHYICSLPKDKGYPEDLTDLKFEIQIRTILQHTWAEIEHDLGYKSEFSIPKDLRREFSRVAGLLEIADESFLRIRNSITAYEANVREKIANDTADDMPLDLVSLRAYLELSPSMKSLLDDIAAISDAIINEANPESFLPLLSFFNLHTLGDLKEFVEEGHDDALFFAKKALEGMFLEELSSIVGLYYLCRSHLVRGDYNFRQLMVYFTLGEASEKRAKQHSEYILKLRKELEEQTDDQPEKQDQDKQEPNA